MLPADVPPHKVFDPILYTEHINSSFFLYRHFFAPKEYIKSIGVKWQTAHGHAKQDENPEMLIKPDDITYEDHDMAFIHINTPTDKSKKYSGGSALLCAYDGENGTGNILWSWHIWVLSPAEYQKVMNNHITVDYNSYQMMDRALGAITTGSTAPADGAEAIRRFGFFYQWGRKDPTAPPTTMTSGINAPNIHVYDSNGRYLPKEFDYEATNRGFVTAIKNPSRRYGSYSDPIMVEHDWWNPTLKTLNDPCPYGYRVPEKGVYDGFGYGSFANDLLGGLAWKGSWFSALGGYAPDNHSIDLGYYLTGEVGRYWMSTPNTSFGAYVSHFDASGGGNSQHDDGGNRSFSYAVRCIKK
jgi:hypothetical protein